jgi:hypothetical protein
MNALLYKLVGEANQFASGLSGFFQDSAALFEIKDFGSV